MAYPNMNGTLAGNDVTYIFAYANQVTNGLFMPFFVFGFFLIVLVTSLIMQLRFSARIRFEFSLLASSFSTLGLCVILSQRNDLINPLFTIISLVLTVFSFIWVATSE